jgi:hypothetical protein
MRTSSLALFFVAAYITPSSASADARAGAVEVGARQATPRPPADPHGPDALPGVHGEERGEGNDDPLLAVSLDGGIPSGMALDLAIGPLDFLRLSAGVTYNLASFGFRAGADLVPFHGGLRPVLAFRLGHAFDGDASRLASLFGAPAGQAALARHVSYDYASAQLGLEVGSERGISAFASGGVAWISSSSPGAAALFRSWAPSITGSPDRPQVHATIPAVNFGIMKAF